MQNSNSNSSVELSQANSFTSSVYQISHRGQIPFIDDMIKEFEKNDYEAYLQSQEYKNIVVNKRCNNIAELVGKYEEKIRTGLIQMCPLNVSIKRPVNDLKKSH
jgi:hypothetical protein